MVLPSFLYYHIRFAPACEFSHSDGVICSIFCTKHPGYPAVGLCHPSQRYSLLENTVHETWTDSPFAENVNLAPEQFLKIHEQTAVV